MPGSVEEQGQSCDLGNVVNAILERTYLVISHAFGISKPVHCTITILFFFDWGSQVCKWTSQVALHVLFNVTSLVVVSVARCRGCQICSHASCVLKRLRWCHLAAYLRFVGNDICYPPKEETVWMNNQLLQKSQGPDDYHGFPSIKWLVSMILHAT